MGSGRGSQDRRGQSSLDGKCLKREDTMCCDAKRDKADGVVADRLEFAVLVNLGLGGALESTKGAADFLCESGRGGGVDHENIDHDSAGREVVDNVSSFFGLLIESRFDCTRCS